VIPFEVRNGFWRPGLLFMMVKPARAACVIMLVNGAPSV